MFRSQRYRLLPVPTVVLLTSSLHVVAPIMCWGLVFSPGPGVINFFSCSTQLSTKFILLINVKMPSIVGILTFISMINTTSERLKAINFFTFRYFSFYEQLKFCPQLN